MIGFAEVCLAFFMNLYQHCIELQGRDKDCIMVSFVRSSKNFRSCNSSLLGDWHRINVAITRAKVAQNQLTSSIIGVGIVMTGEIDFFFCSLDIQVLFIFFMSRFSWLDGDKSRLK